MSYSSFGFGAASAAQVASAIQTADSKPFAQLSVQTLDLLPSQKLAVMSLAAVNASPATKDQLSYLGQFNLAVAGLAVEAAGGGIPLEGLKTVGMEMLKTIYSKVGSMLPSIGANMANETASALGDVIPVIGTGIATMISVQSAWQQASNDKAIKACQSFYEPPAPGTGYGGARMPTDFLNNSTDSSGSTVGNTLQRIGENTSRETYSKSHYAAACKSGPSPSCPYIPHDTRLILHALHVAIRKMRKDPATDGGASLWPIYIDLLWAQFRMGLMNWDWAWESYIKDVLPDFDLYEGGAAAPERIPGGCGKYEKRGYEEAKQVLRNWELTISPIYVQDQAKAKALRAAIAKAEYNLRHPKTLGQQLSPTLLGNLAQMMKPKTTTAPIKAATKMAPAAAVALGMGVAAVAMGGAYWYLKRKKRAA